MAKKHILGAAMIALDGVPCGLLTATSREYQFQYYTEYLQNGLIPLSQSIPLSNESYTFSFAGQLPPYFEHLLPEGWLKEIAEKIDLPMNTSLEELVSLCGNNLGAVEVYNTGDEFNPSYEQAKKFIEGELSKNQESMELFSGDQVSFAYPKFTSCLRCMKPLASDGYNLNFHDKCSEDFFDATKVPAFKISSTILENIASKQLQQRNSLTGVQPKFSAIFKNHRSSLFSPSYIVKPELTIDRSKDGVHYQDSAKCEFATMVFAQGLGLPVADTALVWISADTPAVVSKRFDRTSHGKVHTEDMGQALALRYKYKSSIESIGKVLKSNKSLSTRKHDLEFLAKVTIFNYVIGNSDAHLKNFSLVYDDQGRFCLAPFYDLLPIKLFARNDSDESGLTINGKRSKIQRVDFDRMFINLGVNVVKMSEFAYEMQHQFDSYLKSLEDLGVAKGLIDELSGYAGEKFSVLLR